MDFTLPEELKMLQAVTRRFVQEELLPVEKQVEQTGEFPEEIRLPLKKKAIALGLYSCAMPAEYGGGGLGTMGRVVVSEELGKVSVAVGLAGGIIGGTRSTAGGVTDAEFATPEQLEKYVLPVIRGEKECWMALTESNSGSGDLGMMETRAVKDGDNYIINGTKIFITAIDISDFGYVLAVTDPERKRNGGVTCFIVDNDNPGLIIGRHIECMGRRGLKSYELVFDNCLVPAGNIFGVIGGGMDIFVADMNSVRLCVSATCLGMAQRALDMSKSYAKERITFGQPLSRRQSIQEMIVYAETSIHASRLMLHHTAWEADQGIDVTHRVMMLKAHVPKVACRIIDDAMQIHGGFGYSKDLPLEMMYRDARLYMIGDGAVQVLEWAAARNLLRD